MINFKIKKNRSGFTLVETMVAVFILSLTIISLMSVVSNSLFASRYSRDEITVNYLLQEAVDYIRNDRDSSIVLGSVPIDKAWSNFINKYKECSEEIQGCTIDVFEGIRDPKSSYIKICDYNTDPDNTSCPAFSYDPDLETPFYNYNSGVGTNFKRKIFFKVNEEKPNEIMVKVTVFWLNGDAQKSRSLQTSLLRW